jgi:2,3-bisphosphoglycerate-independent phosphoglycerate mutase
MKNTPRKGTKFILLVGDGMADYPLQELGGKTPLEEAHTPNMDRIADCRTGVVETIPVGMDPGSDVANLSLLGYDPSVYHTGRAPFEAASMGVSLSPDDVAFRLNLVTLDRRSDHEMIMVSHSSGDITTEEAKTIITSLKKELALPGIHIYPGVAYRHLLVWKDGPEEAPTIPPHDVLDQNMEKYLNGGKDPVVDVIRRSWECLKSHPVNVDRKKRGLLQGNSAWLWGQGKALNMPSFKQQYGLTGGVISAVDLLKGIGAYAGLEAIRVEGATGYLDTNYSGKAEEAIKALDYLDFMFVHVEAPDEASHNGNIQEKIQAIEAFDRKVVGAVLKGLEKFDDYRVMVASDHYTPISIKTHAMDPAPFAWASKEELSSDTSKRGFSEKASMESGIAYDKGYELMPAFLAQ